MLVEVLSEKRNVLFVFGVVLDVELLGEELLLLLLQLLLFLLVGRRFELAGDLLQFALKFELVDCLDLLVLFGKELDFLLLLGVDALPLSQLLLLL